MIGGRYGIASKDVTPNQIVAMFDHLRYLQNSWSTASLLGLMMMWPIEFTSNRDFGLNQPDYFQAKFWGFGSDGTVGANKQAIKIIGNNTDMYAQAYFDYDSKNLRLNRFPPTLWETTDLSTYNVEAADYIACHNSSYIHQYDLLKGLKDGGTFS